MSVCACVCLCVSVYYDQKIYQNFLSVPIMKSIFSKWFSSERQTYTVKSTPYTHTVPEPLSIIDQEDVHHIRRRLSRLCFWLSRQRCVGCSIFRVRGYRDAHLPIFLQNIWIVQYVDFFKAFRTLFDSANYQTN